LIDFYARLLKRHEIIQGFVPFAVTRLKFNFKPLFIPKTVKCRPKAKVYFPLKTLNNGALKNTLNHHHKSCIVNRQMRVGDGIFDDEFSPLSPLAPPPIHKCIITILVFLLETHWTVPVITHAHVLQTFYATWLHRVTYQKQFRTKIDRGLG